ncbi:M15 family metallopeptidase [Actinomadura parmotrematis]|uniref:M15 family metallopeptidase n=1 Tax=Actinomadura parmotrematis TaxID=2864039 RepID=A0ABS7FN99_9ACTN|nr:M15 family metallopeptidase [Actinomadura parmotrematis]MBW8481850.1 M15 family metallopeptidase [Actinomadura parmotrematis]
MPSRLPLRAAAFATALATATGCGQGGSDSGASSSATPPTASGSASGSASPGASSASPSPSGTPAFAARIVRVDAGDLPHSWRRGCPVAPSGLRMIEMTYWGMDHRAHTNGRLVVNAKAAADLVKVFRTLYGQRYPIHRMEPVDAYKGSDYDSIEADNTSAFNCRNATGSGNWSQHAYGLAVDLNPCENPYVDSSGHIDHKDCVKFGDRSRRDPGLIHAGDRTVKAFRAIGWGWGGTWSGIKDYQHFSSTGR